MDGGFPQLLDTGGHLVAELDEFCVADFTDAGTGIMARSSSSACASKTVPQECHSSP
jgi:hypothetical protein